MASIVRRLAGLAYSTTPSTLQDAAFQYRPLDIAQKEIRLLEIVPDTTYAISGLVECRLRHVSLAEEPVQAYEAISYCWGDSNNKAEILLEGSSAAVPASAEEVLRRLRKPKESRLVWIDAVCINQNDIQERCSQIVLMTDIYHNSTRCMAYLAPKRRYQAAAVKQLDQIMWNFNNDKHSYEDYLTSGLMQVAIFKHIEELSSAEKRYADFRRLIGCSWFKRLWVVQECILAPQCWAIFGSYERRMDDLLDGLVWLVFNTRTEYCEGARAAFYTASLTRAFRASPLQGQRMLLMTAPYQTTDPKDRLFAVLGLIKPSMLSRAADTIPLIEELLKPDYTRTIAQIYENVTVASLLSTQSAAILCQAVHGPADGEEGYHMASWAMRLDNDVSEERWESPQPRSANEPLSAITTSHIRPPEIGDRALLLAGFQVSAVIDCKFWTYTLDDAQDVLPWAFRTWTQVSTMLRNQSMSIRNSELANTLIMGTFDCASRATSAEMETVVHKFLFAMTLGHDQLQAVCRASKDFHWQVYRFAGAIFSCCRSRSFFITDKQQIGIGPKRTRTGDSIHVLVTVPQPLVLRAVCSQQQVVGPCFIDGVTDGEAAAEFVDGGEPLTTFSLR